MVNKRAVLTSNGPILLAANHPDSFLDAIIIGSLFEQPVHFLARGDAFKKPMIRRILVALKLIPIYRLSEGREYLALNDATFEKCREVLTAGGILLIFSEGLCVNDYGLRPIKKGTARIALDTWKQPGFGDKLKVIPLGINYNFFKGPGKNVLIHFGEAITNNQLPKAATGGEALHYFNQLLASEITSGLLIPTTQDVRPVQLLLTSLSQIKITDQPVIETLQKKLPAAINLNIYSKCRPPFPVELRSLLLFQNALTVVLLFPFAVASYLFHGLLYFPLKRMISKKTNGTVFYDSVLFALLLIVYPIYYLLFLLIAFLLPTTLWLKSTIILMPLIACLQIKWKDSLEELRNYSKLSQHDKRELKQLFA